MVKQTIKKEMQFEIDVKPVNGDMPKIEDEALPGDEEIPIGEEPVEEPVAKEQDGGNVDAVLVQMQDIADTVSGLVDRVGKLEGEKEVEAPLELEANDVEEPKENEEKPIGEEACPEEDTKEEDLAGVPERDTSDSVPTSGDAAIKKQTDTGNADGGALSEVDVKDTKDGDDGGAEAKVPKPTSDLSKDPVTKNAMDEDEEDRKEESLIDKTLRELKEKIDDKTNTVEEDFSALMERQSTVGIKTSESLDNETASETKANTNSVIKEYLQKSGIYNRFV